jgi:hypothetical protein
MAHATVSLALALSALFTATAVQGQVFDTPAQAPPPPYAFSDELGGFSLITVDGIGTRDDPVRIGQIFRTASPVTLVIRATRPINPFGRPEDYSTGTIHMVLDITNETGIPWIGFELELQERFEQPSVYGDGLSFDQRQLAHDGATSNAFANAHYDFEPYDRLLFEEGALNPNNRAEFRFLITDMTPIRTFYVRLDPRIPAS